MYQLIHSKEDGTQTFYDKKRQKLARLRTTTKQSNKGSNINTFGIISIMTTLLSNIAIGKIVIANQFNAIEILLITYLTALISGFFLFCLGKYHQSKVLDRNQIDFTNEELKKLLNEGCKEEQSSLVKFSAALAGLGIFGSIIFFLIGEVMTLIIIWLCTFVSTFFICDSMVHYVYAKKNTSKF